jgi:hypothetical protein
VLDTPAAIDTILIMDIMTIIDILMVTIHIDTATIPIVTTPMAIMDIMVTHMLMVIMGYTDIPMAVITMVTHMGITTATAMVMVIGVIPVGAILAGAIVVGVITGEMRRFVSGME